MGVVCNSTVLIALSRIGHLWVLERLFGNIAIPLAVYNDVVVKGAGKPGARDVAEAKWIHVKAVRGEEQVERLSSILHRGEAEAIALAEEIDADLIILDDDHARRTADSRGLNFTGTLAILLRAKQKGLISHLDALLAQLKSAGFYTGKEYDEILKEAKES